MTHLSLFSGIGGIDLAAHWAGFRTVAFVERDEFCQKVLRKNFPGVPIYDDVSTFDGRVFRGRTDLISGGFPCQDISAAGKGAGIEGARSGLWGEMSRIVSEVMPLWVVVENSPNLRIRGGDRVLGELEAFGYACWPFVVGADHAGAPFKGDRCFMVAQADQRGVPTDGRERTFQAIEAEAGFRGIDTGRISGRDRWQWGEMQSRPFGVADGVPDRVDRLRALGNAVVPQQVYPILKAIADEIKSGKSVRGGC